MLLGVIASDFSSSFSICCKLHVVAVCLLEPLEIDPLAIFVVLVFLRLTDKISKFYSIHNDC